MSLIRLLKEYPLKYYLLFLILIIPLYKILFYTQYYGGYRHFWPESIKFIPDGSLYYKKGFDTAPLSFLLLFFFSKIIPWNYLGAFMNYLNILTHLLMLILIYHYFPKLRKHFFLVNLLVLLIPGVEWSLTLSALFFLLGIINKNDEYLLPVFFALSALSKQLMIIPAFLLIIHFALEEKDFKVKKILTKEFIKKISIQTLLMLFTFILPLTYFGLKQSFERLFFSHAKSEFLFFKFLLTPFRTHILFTFPYYVFPAMLLITCLFIVSKKELKKSFFILLSFIFFFLSQSKDGADYYLNLLFPLLLPFLEVFNKCRKELLIVSTSFSLVFLTYYFLIITQPFHPMIFLSDFIEIMPNKVIYTQRGINGLQLSYEQFKGLENYDNLNYSINVLEHNFFINHEIDENLRENLIENIMNNKMFSLTILHLNYYGDMHEFISTMIYNSREEFEEKYDFFARKLDDKMRVICKKDSLLCKEFIKHYLEKNNMDFSSFYNPYIGSRYTLLYKIKLLLTNSFLPLSILLLIFFIGKYCFFPNT